MGKPIYQCKKCGDLFPDRHDYKHYAVCHNTSIIDPVEVLDSFKVISYIQKNK